MKKCPECYSSNNRITPLLNPKECLENHTQYNCSTCGRCICIEKDDKRHLQRWNFPFKSFDMAMLYLRSAEVSTLKCCGIYEIISSSGRTSYKIFKTDEDFKTYLQKSKKKTRHQNALFSSKNFKSFDKNQIRKLTSKEVTQYLQEKNKD